MAIYTVFYAIGLANFAQETEHCSQYIILSRQTDTLSSPSGTIFWHNYIIIMLTYIAFIHFRLLSSLHVLPSLSLSALLSLLALCLLLPVIPYMYAHRANHWCHFYGNNMLHILYHNGSSSTASSSPAPQN